MIKIVCFTGVFLVFCTFLGAQSPLRMQRFAKALDSLKQKREGRIAAFRLGATGRERTPDGFLLVDVRPGGIPVYKAPLNMYAAITTGVTPLQLGELGLSLKGKGMIVGVWDAGIVTEHVELGDRVIYKEPAAPHRHANHVTGTIIATGINPNAKGMAPLAKARTWFYDYDYQDIFQQQGPDAVKLSNHSYGSGTGWVGLPSGWQWAGDPNISDKEDYHFGFYDLDAWAIDELSNLDPYHAFVWAAGNDRTDVNPGNPAYPKDGNEGTGYDCLIPEAVAKNHIVVGAVSRVLNYTGPASVTMSSFSSWGPTDDGRIKPDLVADGVAVTSLHNTGPNTYFQTQGTSQAAANATGSLILVQELYNRLHGNTPMRSATLRALAIHTTKETGTSAGPDYQYGWGLLDVRQAAQTLLANDDVNVLVRELTLGNQQTITIPLQPQAGQKITVTIGWTDPSGTPVADALDPTDLMLVNDLDVKLVDEDGIQTLPWILDPANPAMAATNGNNFRDNVEKIEFDTPLDKKYNIVITHKGMLTQAQPFSLVVTHQSKITTGTAYYWVGNSGSWSDAAHWSLASGGTTAGSIPTATDRLIIDDNSFSSTTEETITLDGDPTCRSLAWLTSERAALDMGAHTLTTTAMLNLASDTFRITTPGTLRLAGGGQVQLHTNLAGARLLFSAGNWSLGGTVNTARLDIDGGSVDAAMASIAVPELHVNNNATLDVQGKTLTTLTTFYKSAGATLLSEGTVLTVNTSATYAWNGGRYDGVVMIDHAGTLTLDGNNEIDSVLVWGKLILTGSNTLQYLEADAGAQLELGAGETQRPDTLLLKGTDVDPVVIQSTGSDRAMIEFSRHEKICYDYLHATGVDIAGQAVVSAGTHSILANASGWEDVDCEEVLFVNFTAEYTCAHGLTIFTDMSTGTIATWSWNFGDDGSSNNTFSGSNARHQYTQAGTYTVSLTATTASDVSRTYKRVIEIRPNTVPVNTIVFDKGLLVSSQTADNYQWYLNGEVLAAATGKTFQPEAEGNYTAVTTTGDCNNVSDEFAFTIMATEPGAESAYRYAPNPADRELVITTSLPRCTVSIYTAMGQYAGSASSNSPAVRIDTSQLQEGLYVADVNGHKIKFVVLHR